MYRLREVDSAEYSEELAALHAATFTDGSSLVDFDEGHWWIAFLGDEPVAFIGIVQAEEAPHIGYFVRVGVTPEHRGHRLQARLMRAMEQRAKKVGWLTIVTDTRNNPPSANNIIDAGYRMFEPASPWAATDASYWKKDLTHERRKKQDRHTPRRYPAGNWRAAARRRSR